MSWFSRDKSTSKPLTVSRVAFAVTGVGLVLYSMRKQRGLARKVISSAGLGLLAKSLGATSLAGAPAVVIGLLSHFGAPRQDS